MIRIFDIVLSLAALIILCPLLLPIALILRFTGEGEVFYIQERIGSNEQPFGLFKFATMLKNSPQIGTGTITVRNDPRVLPVGRILRKTKINELPQLLNVLIGDMSVIGPRPLTQNHFIHYAPEMRKTIGSVRPGLSGVGSIVFRDEERLLSDKEDPKNYYRTEIAPHKALLEVWFVENRGLWLYLKCIVLTIWVVINSSSHVASAVFKDLPQPQGQLKLDLEGSS
jgi:lipopolysaccharide/colanic/teichoic acid biosynthesis glycosyltransferase